MSWCVSPWVYPLWDSLCLLDLIKDYFLFHVGEVFNYNLFKNFLIHFLFLFFCDPYNSNVDAFDMVPEVSSLVAQRLKRLPAMQKTWVPSLGWEDPLEKEMATHFSILAWPIPWMEEPGGVQSTGSQRVGHD